RGAVDAAGAGGRRTAERAHVGVAANHAVECDDVGRFHLIRQLDEIAKTVIDSIGHALSQSLHLSRGDEGRRGVDAHGPAHSRLEQLQLNPAHPATNVQQRLVAVHPLSNRLHENPARAAEALFAVLPQLARRKFVVELLGQSFALTTAHRYSRRSRRRSASYGAAPSASLSK